MCYSGCASFQHSPEARIQLCTSDLLKWRSEFSSQCLCPVISDSTSVSPSPGQAGTDKYLEISNSSSGAGSSPNVKCLVFPWIAFSTETDKISSLRIPFPLICEVVFLSDLDFKVRVLYNDGGHNYLLMKKQKYVWNCMLGCHLSFILVLLSLFLCVLGVIVLF